MAVDPLYTRGKLGAAVQALAVGKGRIKERLKEAHTELVLVDPKVFALEGLFMDAPRYWDEIWSALTSVKEADPAIGRGPASIDAMTEEKAARVAQQIVSLDAMLDSYLEDRRSR